MIPAEVVVKPGQVVRVRSRQYLVDDVRPPQQPSQQTVVSLSCLDDDAQGQPLEVLWETELDAEVLAPHDWQSVAKRGFDSPRMFGAFLRTQRWNLVTSTNPKLFQAPHRAGIEVMSYQVEPLRKALSLPRVNLFIADDVGLGKTIEAGLILRELLLRQRVKRVVVAAPPSVVVQWQQELDQRFGLPFMILDRAYVQRRRKERGHSANPWKTHTRFIVSHALLRDEQYAAPLRDWLGDFCPGALLILDEAHNAAPAAASKYAVDSNLTKTLRGLVERFEHRLFLSATPHNGHSNSFSALLELLDPQRFTRGVPVDPKQRDAVMVRRLKSDLKAVGIKGFPKREIVALKPAVPADDPTERLLALLDRYAELREASSTSKASALVIISLQKRLLSSIEAFASSLVAHRRGLARKAKAPVATLSFDAPGADDDDDDVDEGDLARDAEVAIEAASAGIDVDGEAAAVLEEMTKLAQQHRSRPDPRIATLTQWLKDNVVVTGKDGKPAFGDRRVLIFTEWMDTRRYLEERLSAVLAELVPDDAHRAQRLATFHGGMGEERREEIKAAFNAEPSQHPLRILLATDAAREGVNLQNHCADLFHFDLPWNPSRLEQRNGRIDRKLQRADVVRCHHFVFPDRPEDVVLRTLLAKTTRIQKELGSLSQVLEQRMSRRLEQRGIRRKEVEALRKVLDDEDLDADAKATYQRELDAGRVENVKLLAELEVLRGLLETSKNQLGLTPEAFEDALSCSLEIGGATPLKKKTDDDGRARFAFPWDDDRVRGDPSWEATLDTLRPPRPRGVKLWDWRREAKPRPVVFSDTGELNADAVHVHLEHRVVQRLLSRFLSQGFLHHDLSRANIVMTRDPRRRVVLLGKLALYGEGASRLHEEIVPVTALWTEPSQRKPALSLLGDKGEDTTLSLLESALTDKTLHDVGDELRALLKPHVATDVQELLPALQQRADAAAARARGLLEERGTREAKEMREVIDRQEEAIRRRQAEVEGTASTQLKLDLFDKEERAQLEADRAFWPKRLAALAKEKEAEPLRIARSYDVKVTRLEPLGVVYLWPTTG